MTTQALTGHPTFWPYFDSGQWRPHTKAALQRLLTPETTFLDIGAWIGPLCIWAAPLCRRIIALEPDPVAYEALVANTAQLSNVETIQAALSDKNSLASLYHRGHFGDSMSSLVPTGEDAMAVQTMSVDRFIEKMNVAAPVVANVNIEGSEAIVLPSLVPRLVELGAPLLLSVHEPWLPSGTPPITDLLSGYSTMTVLSEDGPGFYEVECKC